MPVPLFAGNPSDCGAISVDEADDEEDDAAAAADDEDEEVEIEGDVKI